MSRMICAVGALVVLCVASLGACWAQAPAKPGQTALGKVLVDARGMTLTRSRWASGR
jgi:hypothetical protein